MSPSRLLPDLFTRLLIATVLLASFLPCSGRPAQMFDHAANFGIALLFFLHGARLARSVIIAGALHWRLHLLVLSCTYLLFPLLGWLARPAYEPLLGPALAVGMVYLCVLPSTVQSSIAFTSMARGNVAAAVCSASASNMAGVFLTPLLANLLLAGQGATAGVSLDAIWKIVQQLLLPFVAGQLLSPLLMGWIKRHPKLIRVVDQGSILLVVYTAFSAAVIEGLWQQLAPSTLFLLVGVNALLLALVLLTTGFLARRLGFDRADRIAIIFCGSKKSLATGVPMAKVLFAANAFGAAVLPIMLFHQMQLMTCAVLASRWGAEVAD
ncbi:MAG: bile acid:sodium symporter [Rhodocyclaceae bacterium]|nr:bile acid:sodium symporter [Rhodocyclaceae bacterium]MBX3669826.1 bile acid:sodium symporter [Rhodocyclaceae bacterium]